MTGGVQYIQTGKAFFEERMQREVVHIVITPQKHEIIYAPSYDRSSPYSPEEQRFMDLFGKLRDTARNAYQAVMVAGITALNDGKVLPGDVLQRHFEVESENLLLRLGEVEKERDQWKELAERRKIEVAALERALRPVS